MRFEYNFQEEDPQTLTIDYEDSDDEKLSVSMSGQEILIAGNRSGLLTLAKLCLKLALGKYKPGYHVHINEDFDADRKKVLCIGVE